MMDMFNAWLPHDVTGRILAQDFGSIDQATLQGLYKKTTTGQYSPSITPNRLSQWDIHHAISMLKNPTNTASIQHTINFLP